MHPELPSAGCASKILRNLNASKSVNSQFSYARNELCHRSQKMFFSTLSLRGPRKPVLNLFSKPYLSSWLELPVFNNLHSWPNSNEKCVHHILTFMKIPFLFQQACTQDPVAKVGAYFLLLADTVIFAVSLPMIDVNSTRTQKGWSVNHSQGLWWHKGRTKTIISVLRSAAIETSWYTRTIISLKHLLRRTKRSALNKADAACNQHVQRRSALLASPYYAGVVLTLSRCHTQHEWESF